MRASAVQDTSGSQSGLLRVLKLSDQLEVRDPSFSSASKILSPRDAQVVLDRERSGNKVEVRIT